MNKSELTSQMAKNSGLTKINCNNALDALTKSIIDTVKAEKQVRLVRLVWFGTFYLFARKASDGFNPKTKVKIRIPASNRPKFRAGKQFIESLN